MIIIYIKKAASVEGAAFLYALTCIINQKKMSWTMIYIGRQMMSENFII